MTEESRLSGGNITGAVVRVGKTVRRPSGPWTPAVHALLAHLYAVGFRGAPRPLGIDDRGREILTFAPGIVPWPDRFDLLEPDSRLVRVARLIRDFHDAVESFTPPPDAYWQRLMPPEGEGIIAHNDLAPWNLVIGDDWILIDWDNAGPGSRLWDIACAVHGFVPLSANRRWQRPDAGARLRIFADAYDLTEAQRQELVPMLARRARSMYDLLADRSAHAIQPWTTLWQAGHGDAWLADSEYLEENEGRWARALLA